MSNTPDRLAHANARYVFFRSRSTLVVAFLLILVLGIFAINADGQVFVSIGTSLIAGATISLLTLWIDQIRNAEQTRMAELIDSGLHTAFERRNLSEYETLVPDADAIDVAGYTLKSFSEQNIHHLTSRASKRKPISVRVLLVDPSTEAARAMEKAEDLPAGTYERLCEALHQRLGTIDGVEIRLLGRPLSMMIYRIDKFIYTGPFPASGRSSTAFTLKLEDPGWLYEHQKREFDSLWNEAYPKH